MNQHLLNLKYSFNTRFTEIYSILYSTVPRIVYVCLYRSQKSVLQEQRITMNIRKTVSIKTDSIRNKTFKQFNIRQTDRSRKSSVKKNNLDCLQRTGNTMKKKATAIYRLCTFRSLSYTALDTREAIVRLLKNHSTHGNPTRSVHRLILITEIPHRLYYFEK